MSIMSVCFFFFFFGAQLWSKCFFFSEHKFVVRREIGLGGCDRKAWNVHGIFMHVSKEISFRGWIYSGPKFPINA